MPIYLCASSRADLELVTDAVQSTTSSPLVTTQTPAELLDYLLLREGTPSSVRLVIAATFDAAAAPHLLNWLAEYQIPTLLMCENEQIDSSLSLLEKIPGDIARRPIVKAEFLGRMRMLLRLRSEQYIESVLEKELRNPTLDSDETGPALPEFGAMIRFLAREWKRCLRYGWPLSVLQCSLLGGRELSPGDQRDLETILNDCFRRPGDYLTGSGQNLWTAVCSETDREGIAHVAERLVTSVPRGFGNIVVGTGSIQPIDLYHGMRHTSDKKEEPAYRKLLKMANVALDTAKREGRSFAQLPAAAL